MPFLGYNSTTKTNFKKYFMLKSAIYVFFQSFCWYTFVKIGPFLGFTTLKFIYRKKEKNFFVKSIHSRSKQKTFVYEIFNVFKNDLFVRFVFAGLLFINCNYFL